MLICNERDSLHLHDIQNQTLKINKYIEDNAHPKVVTGNHMVMSIAHSNVFKAPNKVRKRYTVFFP